MTASVESLLQKALALPGASFVVYRRGLLVEFQTDKLTSGLSRWEEEGHISWQVNGFEDHHCHVDLASIERVQFDAEPVGCQGGRLNFTAWFLAGEDTGNPYRPRAAFSITLNRPYEPDGTPRLQVLGPLVQLFEEVRGLPFVEATEAVRGGARGLGAYPAVEKERVAPSSQE
jgi:hypothetical protein